MSNKWRERLNKLLEEENTLHTTTTTLRERVGEFPGNVKTLTVKTAETQAEGRGFSENLQNPAAKTAKTPSDTERLGLVATWSVEFGYISLHDPTTGEWHDLQTKDAPDWAKREAFKRKELYRAGNRNAYRMTAREMEEIWEVEAVPMWDHPAVDDRGLIYEDYLGED